MPNPIDSLYIDGVLYDIQPSYEAYSGRALYSVGMIECSSLYYGACMPYQMFKHNIHLRAGAEAVGREWFDLGFTIYSTRSTAYNDVFEVATVLDDYAKYGYPWPVTSYKDTIYLDSKRGVVFALPCTGQFGWSGMRWQTVMIAHPLKLSGGYDNLGLYGIPFYPDPVYADNTYADWIQEPITGKTEIQDNVVA